MGLSRASPGSRAAQPQLLSPHHGPTRHRYKTAFPPHQPWGSLLLISFSIPFVLAKWNCLKVPNLCSLDHLLFITLSYLSLNQIFPTSSCLYFSALDFCPVFNARGAELSPWLHMREYQPYGEITSLLQPEDSVVLTDDTQRAQTFLNFLPMSKSSLKLLRGPAPSTSTALTLPLPCSDLIVRPASRSHYSSSPHWAAELHLVDFFEVKNLL